LAAVKVISYRESDGECPLMDWFDGLPAKARAKCFVRIERLTEMGHELRRPEADYLRDHIYELRAKHDGVNYRMLYFFIGRGVAVISHGITKQREDVPNTDIELAIRRMKAFSKNPTEHTFEG